MWNNPTKNIYLNDNLKLLTSHNIYIYFPLHKMYNKTTDSFIHYTYYYKKFNFYFRNNIN